MMKRGYPFTSGNLNFGYNYDYVPKTGSSGGGGGERGSPGPLGPPGPSGIQGPPGQRGPQGDPGPAGPAGTQGLPGQPGNIGPRGPKGDKGAKGDQGLQGPIGHNGQPGPRGQPGTFAGRGDKGDKGDKGNKGDKGDRGVKGVKGDPGPPGPVGPTGPHGAAGAPGADGKDGVQGGGGAAGAQGPKGQNGNQGPRGFTGPPGGPGAQGPPGSDGTDGVQGPPGPRGQKGDTGPRGAKGPKGDSGGLSDTGFTMQDDIDMHGNKIIGLGTPTTRSEPVTKHYGDSTYLTNGGFVMRGDIDMGDYKITNLGTPTNNTDGVNKKYVDDKKYKLDKTIKKQIVMVDKIFEKITYEDSSGNTKGFFETFQFASTGKFAPYNGGRGQNLVVDRETRKEKVPHMGFRAPLKIEQDIAEGESMTEIAFTTPQTRQDKYGMIFSVKFLNETGKALKTKSAFTDTGNVNTAQSIKSIGSINLNGNVYQYFLVKVDADALYARSGTAVQFNFTSSKLKNGKMIMESFEGFTFNNFSDSDYNSANITTHTPYLHQKDFDKNKFQDVMVGDTLLAGMKQDDGTVVANESLRLTLHNIINTIPHRMTFLLPYISPADAKTQNSNWCRFKAGVPGYPIPVLPCQGTGKIIITLLTHTFDKDNTIPTANLTFQYRLKIYEESVSTTSEYPFRNIDYTGTKRSVNTFYLNTNLMYTPTASCIGFTLEFRQKLPETALGNESQLIFEVNHIL